ncbi:bifunctional pyr operon transcriptional regulator/uracil phosphoribosyltransferase PyrR [bacterium]|nr:bifunctional pyr operon transcriptional regulator/uracil phosphoribosyltransferase PyrR [bacterium]
MNESLSRQIMDADHIRRAINRMAYEICEHNKGIENLALIGIMTRGDVLAQRIADQIGKIEKDTPAVGALDITFHRDDTSMRTDRQPGRRPSHLPFQLENRKIVLVDDVLNTGRSIRAAMDELIDYGRPQEIQLAVLVDRGHRELPIHADYVGKNLPTATNEKVDVLLQECDRREGVFIIR